MSFQLPLPFGAYFCQAPILDLTLLNRKALFHALEGRHNMRFCRIMPKKLEAVTESLSLWKKNASATGFQWIYFPASLKGIIWVFYSITVVCLKPLPYSVTLVCLNNWCQQCKRSWELKESLCGHMSLTLNNAVLYQHEHKVLLKER